EDLHWADEGLLDFVDYLADWATGVPILIVGTARPELLDRRPGWGGGKRNAATVSISALSADETARLLGQLLEQALLPAEIQAGVVGKGFWRGAVAAIGGASPFALDEPLHALERKEFVRRERRSSVGGETQYAFLHLLVRDVAYGQIPRARRVDKHRAAAEWIASLAADRSGDRAQMLAHPYVEARERARASGGCGTHLPAAARAALI